MKINKSFKFTKKYKIVIALVAIVLIGLGVYAFYVYKDNQERIDKFGSNKINPDKNTPAPSQKSENDTPNQGSISNSPNTDHSNNLPPMDSNSEPRSPVGVFASNHRPNISGSPSPSVLSSTCSTSPGAFCYIEFTNGTIKKSLPQKQVDQNGNTSWDWDIKDIGLTSGTWKVTAIAVNGSMQVKTQDPMDLVVKE